MYESMDDRHGDQSMSSRTMCSCLSKCWAMVKMRCFDAMMLLMLISWLRDSQSTLLMTSLMHDLNDRSWVGFFDMRV